MGVLEHIIGDLLLRHNCVIIPSFGGFVAKPVSAQIDYSKGIINPPSKSVLFNKQLVNNDGLLINELAQRESLSYDEAERSLATIVADWNTRLRSGNRIEIEKVGILYFDEENKVAFEQDRFSNLLLESFGLGSVSFVMEHEEVLSEATGHQYEETILTEPKLVAIKPEPINEAIEEKDSEGKIIEHPALEQVKKKRSAWKYVAAACLLPALFYSIWIPVKTDVLESGVLSIKDFNPFYHTSEGSYSDIPLRQNLRDKEDHLSLEEEIEGVESDYYTYRIDGTSFIAVELNQGSSNETAIPVEPSQQSFNPEAMNYIVGCFGNEENAINLVAKLKSQGFNARIVDVHNGLHRVTAGEGLSAEAISEIKSAAEASGYKGWILK